MLKLIRMENTLTFAIVDDEKFEEDMEVLGCVRINYKDGMPLTKVYGAHKEEWFKELYKKINEKKIQLANEEYVRPKVSLEAIIIEYILMKGETAVNISNVKQLLKYILCQLVQSKLVPSDEELQRLEASYDIENIQCFEYILMQDDYIVLKDSSQMPLRPGGYTSIDGEILDMVAVFAFRKFCAPNSNE